jgi:zinc transport system substrate-binding protein
MSFRLALTALILAAAFALPARALTVLTDLAPVRAIVAAVAGPAAEVSALIKPGLSPHDFALRPSDTGRLSGADLVIWLGPDSTPGLAHLLAGDRPDRVLALNAVPETARLPLRPAGLHDAEDADDHAHDDDDEIHGRHDDPHTWLDPENAALWAEAIAVRLATLDPDNAGLYHSQARELIRAIAETRGLIERDLAATPPTPFVQFHDAFHHFEARFALTPLGAATAEDEESLSLGVVADLRAALADAGAACLFVPDDATALRARPLLDPDGVALGRLDALGRALSDGFTYPDLLRAIADGYLDCFRAAAR